MKGLRMKFDLKQAKLVGVRRETWLRSRKLGD
jgi:hypothetical protein